MALPRYNPPMSEADAIALSKAGPVTREWLELGLRGLGIRRGSIVLVHCALSRLGWVTGGARTVYDALLSVLGPQGTLLVPAFSTYNTNPANWQNPPVPADWVPIIRAQMPPYDPRLSPLREMGALPEHVLRLPEVVRSGHPALSWAGAGPRAAELLAEHELADAFGEHSPLGAAKRAGADVVSLGCVRTTILHHAETLADYPGKEYRQQGGAINTGGQRRWAEYTALEGDDGDFEQLRQGYIAAGLPCSEGTVGYGQARRFPARKLVDFAVKWLEEHRK